MVLSLNCRMMTEPRHDDLTSPVLMLLRQHPKAAELTLRCYFARAVSKGDRQLGDNIPCERGFADHASASATLPALHPMRTKMARQNAFLYCAISLRLP
jgi:hypothetical protein